MTAPQSRGTYAFYSQGMKKEEIQINDELRKLFAHLADAIHGAPTTINPRYRSLAITHLETAAMYATKMLSHNDSHEGG